MFDLTKSAEQEALEKVRDFTTKNYGRVSYILAMREESGELKLHHRANQPCYGELRKYFATHEDQYTDPEPHDEYRPGDLHDPFPEGTPEGLGLNFNNWDTIFSQEGSVVKELIPVRDRLIRYAFSENSPWRRGIVPGTIEFVEAPVVIKASFPDHIKKNSYTAFGKDKFETNAIAGIIMRDLSVDPTVSVNLFNNIKWVFSTESAMGFAKMLFDQGASDLEVLGLLQIAIIHRIWSEESELRASDYRNYYHPSFLDWRRFSTGDPHNLTGGLLKDRYDYNRSASMKSSLSSCLTTIVSKTKRMRIFIKNSIQHRALS